MNTNKLFSDITETEQSSAISAEDTPEQDANDTVAATPNDGESVPAQEQAEEKKQRKKRTKKSEVTDTAAVTAESEDTNIPGAETEPNESDTKSTAEESASGKQYKTGDSVDIRLALLYSSSVAPKHFRGIKGRYYVWSGTAVNGRIRLTDSPSGVGKPERVIGWVKIKNIL